MSNDRPRLRRLLLGLAALAPVTTAAFLVLSTSRRSPADPREVEPLLASKRFDEATAKVEERLRSNPDDPGAHLLMAQIALARDDQRPELALEHLARIRTGSRSFLAIVRLNEGKAFSAMGRYDRAEDAWIEALRLDPHVPEAGWALLGLYYIQGRREEAHRLGLRLHAEEPDPRDRVQLLVELLRQDAQTPVHETLIPTLAPIVRDHPEDLHTAIALGLAMVRSSRANEGIAILRDAIRRNPENPDAWDSLLLGLDEATRLDELAEATAKLPPSIAGLPRFDRYRGSIAQDRREWNEAAEAFRRARRSDPSDFSSFYRLIRILRLAGRGAEAEALDPIFRAATSARQRALSLYHEVNAIKDLGTAPHPELYRRIADLREQMGRPDEALAWHRLILRERPDDPISRAAVERIAANLQSEGNRG